MSELASVGALKKRILGFVSPVITSDEIDRYSDAIIQELMEPYRRLLLDTGRACTHPVEFRRSLELHRPVPDPKEWRCLVCDTTQMRAPVGWTSAGDAADAPHP